VASLMSHLALAQFFGRNNASPTAPVPKLPPCSRINRCMASRSARAHAKRAGAQTRSSRVAHGSRRSSPWRRQGDQCCEALIAHEPRALGAQRQHSAMLAFFRSCRRCPRARSRHRKIFSRRSRRAENCKERFEHLERPSVITYWPVSPRSSAARTCRLQLQSPEEPCAIGFRIQAFNV